MSLILMLRRLVAPLSRSQWFRSAAPTFLPPAERALKFLTGGRLIVSGILVPSLALHSMGAKTGEPRTTELMYTPDGNGGAIIAGTNFARNNHPGWTVNLRAHPDAEVVVRGRRYPVHAEPLDDLEREAAWARIEKQWPGYRAYERDSGRKVRLFRLTTAVDPSPFTHRL